MTTNLIEDTDEQEKIIQHPRGSHARVLAVAGSGKTTTMVHRVRHLVRSERVPPQNICILMFNKLAREDFTEKLKRELEPHERPAVHTFHSFAFSIIQKAIQIGRLPATLDLWEGDRSVRKQFHLIKAINNLEEKGLIPPDSVDPEEADTCIGLWKGSLIPPKCAGHKSNNSIPKVYAEFERLRNIERAITFDDFVPYAIGILESENDIRKQESRYDTVVVDEYQDVNFGQQYLIEILSGNRADLMLVGDDDQTIYEWRGARPEYILTEYEKCFRNKPFITYSLSGSFRLGPFAAQCAENLIEHNKKREKKRLHSHRLDPDTEIMILKDQSEQSTDINKILAEQVKILVRETGNPTEVIVLARQFSQFSGIEMEFFLEKIPYRVIGRSPFYDRREISALIDYLRIAIQFHSPIFPETIKKILSIANIPNRMLNKKILRTFFEDSEQKGLLLDQAFRILMDPVKSPFSKTQRDSVEELLGVLERLSEIITSRASVPVLASEYLKNTIRWTGYCKHFDNYYGKGENSEDRKATVRSFVIFVEKLGLTLPKFFDFIAAQDSTQGRPLEEQIVLTTVFRVKGMEFDYVIIPQCVQGTMPCPFAPNESTFDTCGIATQPSHSDPLENERRLFYVAITRARKGVYIGTTVPPPKGSQLNSSSPQPSQFLDEMKTDATREILRRFREYQPKDCTSYDNLCEALVRHGGHKKLVNDIISCYLPKKQICLSPEIVTRITSVPEIKDEPAVPPLTPSIYKKGELKWWELKDYEI